MFYDIKANYNSGFSTVIFLINYRLGRWFLKSKYKKNIFLPFYLLCKFVSRTLSFFLGCSIPFSCDLGRSLLFVHGLHGVFISGKAKIGDNCTILHHVTIGSNIGSCNKYSAPIIGNNVFLGAGVRVIGDVKIGDNCMLGAGSLIVKDVPANSKSHAPVAVIHKSSV